MTRCTAPVRGHSSSAAAAACPACRHRSSGYGGHSGYSSYGERSYSYSAPNQVGGGAGRARGSSTRTAKPRWSGATSPVFYTPAEVQALAPIRRNIEGQGVQLDRRDVFLCHAWDDRQGIARTLHDLLVARGVSVWFSEKDVGLGVPLMRAIDKGLANSRIGLVLVTPALLQRLPREGIADKELSALLARDQLVPIVHNTTYEDLREVSPLLASRSGLSTEEESLEGIADKLRELITI